ncbi:MAG TPA: hypothetical protein VFP36_15200, partial [Usitatibacter sp.]|nr:hypothetical protein [Usitatibacter sp.]
MKTFFFIAAHGIRWTLLGVFVAMVLKGSMFRHAHDDAIFGLIVPIALLLGLVTAYSHVQRVKLIAGPATLQPFANRHRRQVEIPLPPGDAFAMVDAAIRELPGVDRVESAPDSLQVSARVKRRHRERSGGAPGRGRPDWVFATLAPGDDTCSLTLVCHPEAPFWLDWFRLDHGSNLQNIEAITRAVMHRIAERRKGEKAQARETATEKELTVAQLSLLHAQVEPHFL